MEQVRALHPGWEIVFFSDGDCREFVANQTPHFLELYDYMPKPVMRADLFRLLVVHLLGGFYLDTDVWLNRPLDKAAELTCVFPWEREMNRAEFDRKFPKRNRGAVRPLQVGNYAFGSAEKHPFLRGILKELVSRTANWDASAVKDDTVLYATGPDLLTSVKYHSFAADPSITMLYGRPDLEVPFPGVHMDTRLGWFRFGDFGTHLMSGVWRGRN